jgi:hypothetical protein
MIASVSNDNVQDPDAPHPGDDGENESAGHRDEDEPAGRPRPVSAAFGATPVLSERERRRLEQLVARSFTPQLEMLLRRQQIAKNVLRSFGGFERLQKQLLTIQPLLESLHGQQLLMENALRRAGWVEGLQKQILANEKQLEAFRRFAKFAVPPLLKLPQLNLPRGWFPCNWEDVIDLDIDAALGIMLDEGIPLVWVPRPAIVAELVSAPDADARDGILLSLRDDIVDDCLTVLEDITTPELKPLVELAIDAANALRNGHDSSAQALAANVFDTLLRDVARRGVIFAGPPIGYFKYEKIRKRITPVGDDTAIVRFRVACVLSAALTALEDYYPTDPPPTRFVRHATAHCAHPAQYAPVNAVVAVMLMVSMLQEAQASSW